MYLFISDRSAEKTQRRAAGYFAVGGKFLLFIYANN